MTVNSASGWTAESIRARLGVSTLAFPGDVRVGAREIAAVRAAGITRVEICGLHPPTHYDYDDRQQIAELKSACQSEGVAIVSVHGPGIPYDCPWERVRRAAVEETLIAVNAAQELGACIFVGHFSITDASLRTVSEVLGRTDDGIKLVVENGRYLHSFRAFTERVGSSRFGMVVDIGHTRDQDGVNPFLVAERARTTLAGCGARLLHLHLHDFKDGGDHYPPFDGGIQWDEIMAALAEIGYGGELMFEPTWTPMPPRDACQVTLQKVAAFPDRFVERYS